MKVKTVLGILAIIIGVAVFSFFQFFQANAMHDPTVINLNAVDRAAILSATLQIEISIQADEHGQKYIKAEGLGSLVWDGERTLLVTHNHWGETLQENATVKLYDAYGHPVKTMSGSEFISLMVYLDAGTLILHSPVDLMVQAQPVLANEPVQLKPGDVVIVAQHVATGEKEVALSKLRLSRSPLTEGCRYSGLETWKGDRLTEAIPAEGFGTRGNW